MLQMDLGYRHEVEVVYLAGPMRGVPGLNFPAFNRAASNLRDRGLVVHNPAERADAAAPLPLHRYMEFDLPLVCASDAVVVLPGWQESDGAHIETTVADMLGIPVLSYPSLAPARHASSLRFHEILRHLGRLHDRKQADYGREDDPFANVRASEEWGTPSWIGTMIRATDKMRRLQAQALRGSLSNESAADSFDDLAVYSVIGRILFEEATSE